MISNCIPEVVITMKFAASSLEAISFSIERFQFLSTATRVTSWASSISFHHFSLRCKSKAPRSARVKSAVMRFSVDGIFSLRKQTLAVCTCVAGRLISRIEIWNSCAVNYASSISQLTLQPLTALRCRNILRLHWYDKRLRLQLSCPTPHEHLLHSLT